MWSPRIALALLALVFLAEARSAAPEIVFLNPPKAPLGAKIRLEGHGFTGTTRVVLRDLRWSRDVEATFTVLSDETLEVQMPASSNPYPFFEKLAFIVETPAGVTVTLPVEPDSSVMVIKSGTTLTSFGAGSRLVFLESGSSILNAGGGSNTFFVAQGASLNLAGGGGTTAYVANGATFTGTGALNFPEVDPSYVTSLFEFGTPPPSYTLTEIVTGSGSIVITPRQNVYYNGQTVELTTVPGEGFAFSEWGGAVSGSDRKVSLVINEDTTVSATFVAGANLYVQSARGQVAVVPQMQVYPLGTSVTLTFTPDRGYEFDRWTGSVASEENPLTMVLTQTSDLTAEVKDPSFGKLLWSYGEFQTSGPGPMDNEVTWSVPAIGDDGTIYVSSYIRAPRSVSDGKLIAIRPDGTERWSQPIYLDSDTGFLGHPVIGNDGSVYINSGPLLSAFSRDGVALWTKSFGATTDATASISPPAIGSDGTLYLAQLSGKLIALSPAKAILWELPITGDLYYTPSVGTDGTIYVGGSGIPIRAVQPDGTVKWVSTSNLPVGSSAALMSNGDLIYRTNGNFISQKVVRLNASGAETAVYGLRNPFSNIAIDPDGKTMFGEVNGSVIVLNPDGTIAWEDQPSPASFTEAPLIGADGTVYFSSTAADTHRFIAYNPDGTVMWENNALAQHESTGNVRCALALDRNGVLYGGSRTGKFYAIQATGKLATGEWPKQFAGYRNESRQPLLGPATAPELTTAPEATEVIADQELVLSAEFTGVPAPEYQWYRDGQPIPRATSPILSVPNVQAAEAGQYFVRATNSAGTAQSTPVAVDVFFSLNVAATGGGSVTMDPEQNLFAPGTQVTLTATAADNFEFVGWTGSASGSENPLLVTMDSNKTLTANFVGYYELVVTQTGSGGVMLDPPGPYLPGQSVTATAVPAVGYGFAGWSGALTGLNPVGSFDMTGDLTLDAVFVPLRTLTVAAQPGGSAAADPQQATYLDGSTVTLTATREEGYDFTGWEGDVASQTNPLTITLDRDILVRATFGPAQNPTVMFGAPNDSTVSDRTFSLTGQITDNDAIDSARWERDGQDMGNLPLTDGLFDLSALALSEGLNQFRIFAVDSVGNETIETFTITWSPTQLIEVLPPESESEGRLIVVPIRLTSSGDVAGATFTLTFDPTYLQSEDFSFSSSASSPFNQINRSIDGQIRASMALTGTLPAGAIEVAHAVFRLRSVPADLNTALGLIEVSASDFSGDLLDDSTAAHGKEMAILKRRVIGDINANGQLDVGDASLMQRLVTGLNEVRAWDHTANDLNSSNTLDVGDVLRVLSTAANLLPQPSAGAVAAGVAKSQGAAAAADSEAVRLVADRRTAAAGDTVVVRAFLENATTPITGVSFVLDYPTDALRLIDSSSHTAGDLIESTTFATVWNVAPARNDYTMQTGTVYMASSSATVASAANGVLAEFTFQVQPGAAAQLVWPVTLHDVNVTSDGYTMRSLPMAEHIFNGWPVLFADWAEGAFQNVILPDPDDRKFDRDPDRDGLINWLEYHFGLNPMQADAPQPFTLMEYEEDGTSYLAVAFDRRRDSLDAACRVEVSRDLETWNYNGDTTAMVHTVEISATDNGDGTERVLERTAASVSPEEKMFIRLTVSEK